MVDKMLYSKLFCCMTLALAATGALSNSASASQGEDSDRKLQGSLPKVMHINDIEVRGLYRVTKGAVLLSLPIQAGDDVTREDVAQALRKVFRTSNFDMVNAYYTSQGVLIIDVKERPTIVNVSYAGNNAIKAEQLDDIIKAHNVKTGEILDVEKLRELEASLEDYYNSTGRYQAKVSTILVYLPRNRVDVKFNFTEGVSAKIEQINIVGNKSFPEEKLLAQLELRDYVPWWNFLADRTFQAQKFSGDLETIRSFYMNRGYVRFRIDSTRVEMTPDRKGIYLSISINEGDQYSFDKFNVIGETYGHGEEMLKLIPLIPGEVYDANQVSHTEELLANYMGKFGYAYTKVKAIPVIDDEKKLVSLNFSVDPGHRIYVTDVRITGNTITTDEVVRRELRQMDGTWLSNEAISTSKRRLDQLGFFETVDITPRKTGTDGDTVEVVTTVKERPTGSIKAGIGFGTETGINLNAEISQDNFLGYGGNASLGVNTNKYDQKIELRYDEPYFTVDGVSLGGSIYYEKFEAGDANIVDYTNEKFGASLGLGYPIDEHNFIRYNIGYEHNRLSQTSSFIQIQRFWDTYVDKNIRNGKVVFQNYTAGLYFSRNYLDRGALPTDGSKQTLYGTVAIPGSDTRYYKLGADTTHFFPLDKDRKFIVNFRAKAGYGNGYGSRNGIEETLPFFQNYYLGGDEWLRGFKYNAVGPKALYNSFTMGNVGVMGSRESVGGNAIVAGSLSLIIPTPFASEGYDRSLRTSIFLDAGSLWDTNYDPGAIGQCFGKCDYIYDYSDPKEYRMSAGVTLVWVSPMGPIGFSLAEPIRKRDGDRTEFFSFSLGRTF